MVSNKDIGFVHAGQEAEIKIDTFDFTKYRLHRARTGQAPGRRKATDHRART
jgi:hypothetical protein